MDAVYVAMKDDRRGEQALALLARAGHKTKILSAGQTAPPEAVALFSPTGPVTVEISPERMAELEKANRHRKAGERGGYYLCCSGVVLEKIAPTWAKTTPLRVGIKSTEDRRLTRPNRGTFAAALETMVLMFRAWDFASASLVPWIRTDKDPNFERNGQTLQRVLDWRDRFSQSGNAKEAAAALVACDTLKKKLRSLGGYYVFSSKYALQISPDFFEIGSASAALIEKNGPLVWEFWQQAEQTYRLAITEGRRELAWLPASVEGPIKPKQQEWQRRLALNQKGVLPLFARADLSSFWFLNEIQERIGGMGLVESWTRATRSVKGSEGLLGDPNGFANAFAEAVKAVTGKDHPVVALICPAGYQVEQRFFAKLLREFGVEAYVIRKETLGVELRVREGFIYVGKKGPKVDLLYRREINAASMALSRMGRAIMEAVLNGNLLVEPPLNMIYDCKTPLAWVSHPETKGFFSSRVRTIISPTVLMPPDPNEDFRLGNEVLTLNQLVGRSYVVKYGGENLKYSFGGRAVYHTEDNDEGIERGLAEVAAGNPWVIQPMDKTRYRVRKWDRQNNRLDHCEGAGRIMLHYARDPRTGKVTLALTAANVRPDHWKAAGNKDAVFQEVRLRKD